MTDFPSERIAASLESIAKSLDSAVTLLARVVDHEYPVRPEPQDATITRIPSELDELTESLGSTGEETTEEWLELGEREKQFVSRSERKRTPAPED